MLSWNPINVYLKYLLLYEKESTKYQLTLYYPFTLIHMLSLYLLDVYLKYFPLYEKGFYLDYQLLHCYILHFAAHKTL